MYKRNVISSMSTHSDVPEQIINIEVVQLSTITDRSILKTFQQ